MPHQQRTVDSQEFSPNLFDAWAQIQVCSNSKWLSITNWPVQLQVWLVRFNQKSAAYKPGWLHWYVPASQLWRPLHHVCLNIDKFFHARQYLAQRPAAGSFWQRVCLILSFRAIATAIQSLIVARYCGWHWQLTDETYRHKLQLLCFFLFFVQSQCQVMHYSTTNSNKVNLSRSWIHWVYLRINFYLNGICNLYKFFRIIRKLRFFHWIILQFVGKYNTTCIKSG